MKQCTSLDMYDMVRGWHAGLKQAMYEDFTMRNHKASFDLLPERAQNALEALASVMYLVEGELARSEEDEKP